MAGSESSTFAGEKLFIMNKIMNKLVKISGLKILQNHAQVGCARKRNQLVVDGVLVFSGFELPAK
jgi:hypothetical protein